MEKHEKEAGCCSFPFHSKKHANRSYAFLVCCNFLMASGIFWTALVCVAIGLFCNDSEENSIHLVSSMKNGNSTSLSAEMVGYYLKNTPPENFIVEALRKVRNILKIVSNNLWLLKPVLEGVGLLCNDMGNIDLVSFLDDAIPDIEQILPLTKRDRVYHYFDQLANRGVCVNAANSLSIGLIIQVIICCILVPYVSIQLHNFMSQTEAYNSHKKYRKAGEVKKLLDSGVYHCQNCRATFEKPPELKKEFFTNYNDSKLVHDSLQTRFDTVAQEMKCPECGSKNLVPGRRKDFFDEEKVSFEPCSLM